MKIGLVLEGGGFRGVFVEGITDWLIDQGIEIPYVIGVSMGASNGCSYITKQKSRNLKIVEQFIDDPRYISTKNLVTQGSLFGMDFIFNDIANIHNKFDFEAFQQADQEMVIGAMNCQTGHTTYIKKSDHTNEEMMDALRASISLPFISKIVPIDNTPHLDGGVTDPIPVIQALKDGCDKVIVISTRDKAYVKEAFKGSSVGKVFYRNYPKVTEALSNRYLVYTKTQGSLQALEMTGKALILQPDHPLEIGRTEKNIKKVRQVHTLGYLQAEKRKLDIYEFLGLNYETNK